MTLIDKIKTLFHVHAVEVLIADAPKIEQAVLHAIENELKSLGVKLVADATNPTSAEAKEKLISTALSTVASSVATSVVGHEVVVTLDQVSNISKSLVVALDNIEQTIGQKI